MSERNNKEGNLWALFSSNVLVGTKLLLAGDWANNLKGLNVPAVSARSNDASKRASRGKGI